MTLLTKRKLETVNKIIWTLFYTVDIHEIGSNHVDGHDDRERDLRSLVLVQMSSIMIFMFLDIIFGEQKSPVR